LRFAPDVEVILIATCWRWRNAFQTAPHAQVAVQYPRAGVVLGGIGPLDERGLALGASDPAPLALELVPADDDHVVVGLWRA
jgi:hypothetical protein